MVDIFKSQIGEHYKKAFSEYGDTFKGMDWPSEASSYIRYEKFLSLQKQSNAKILDYGCGSGLYLDYLKNNHPEIYRNNSFSVYDLNMSAIETLVSKHPDATVITETDLMKGSHNEYFDYIIINGVFTEKLDIPYHDFCNFFRDEITNILKMSSGNIAVNVMSNNTQWCYKDLFHLSLDEAYKLLDNKNIELIFHTNYGLYEYIIEMVKSMSA